MKKKVVSLLLVAIMLVAALPLAAIAEKAPEDYITEGRLSGISADGKWNLSLDLSFDIRSLIKTDNTVYNEDIAKAASFLACDEYSDYSFKLEGSGNKLIADMGFKDIKTFDTSDLPDADTHDVRDKIVFTVGRRVVDGNVVYATVFSSNGYKTDEWLSDFDPGADTEAYYAITGEHPLWLNKENHKGFDVAATRAALMLSDYLGSFDSADGDMPKSILTTGHSRGGAIANIVGTYLEDLPDFKTYTYTFACPATTTSAIANDYETIFNIINEDDVISALPLKKWGFKRYGKDYITSVTSDFEEEWNSIMNSEYPEPDGGNAWMYMNGIAESREDLYEINDKFTVLSAALNLFGEDLTSFYKVESKNAEKHTADIVICPAFYMNLLGKIVAGDDMLPNVLSLLSVFVADIFDGSVSNGLIGHYATVGIFLLKNANALEAGHISYTYCIIADNLKVCKAAEIEVAEPEDNIWYNVSIGSFNMGKMKTELCEGGFRLKTALGYLKIKNGLVVFDTSAENASVWTLSNGSLRTKYKGYNFYLSSFGCCFGAVLCPFGTKASFRISKGTDTHCYGEYIESKDGKHHYRLCEYCGNIERGCHTYEEDGIQCDICKAYSPNYQSIEFIIQNKPMWFGFFFMGYKYEMDVKTVNCEVSKVEYKFDKDSEFKEGTEFYSYNEPETIFIRLTVKDVGTAEFMIKGSDVYFANGLHNVVVQCHVNNYAYRELVR